jgi:predicted AAA+ superfamily ATPase
MPAHGQSSMPVHTQIAYSECGGELSYYRTPSGTEVDFIWSRGGKSVGIEVQASARWRAEYSRALIDLHQSKVVAACYGVYLGETPLRIGPLTVLPLPLFLQQLAAGKILSPPRGPKRIKAS